MTPMMIQRVAQEEDDSGGGLRSMRSFFKSASIKSIVPERGQNLFAGRAKCGQDPPTAPTMRAKIMPVRATLGVRRS